MKQFPGMPVRVLVVWEPVLVTDWTRPSTVALARIRDARAVQFWDGDRLVSHAFGEHSRKTIVWDDISVYAPGVVWDAKPPVPAFRGRTVVGTEEQAKAAVAGIFKTTP